MFGLQAPAIEKQVPFTVAASRLGAAYAIGEDNRARIRSSTRSRRQETVSCHFCFLVSTGKVADLPFVLDRHIKSPEHKQGAAITSAVQQETVQETAAEVLQLQDQEV